MEGLQGFALGFLVGTLVTGAAGLYGVAKAFYDGHIAGQKACGRVEPEK
jgi:hypothetical protein